MRRANVIGALAMVAALSACNKSEELTIRNVDPQAGTHYGGEFVRIRGTGFASGGTATGVTIYFGDRDVRPQQIVGDSEIIVKTPPGPKDEKVDIQLVFDDARQATLKDAFEYKDLSEGFGVDELVTGETETEGSVTGGAAEAGGDDGAEADEAEAEAEAAEDSDEAEAEAAEDSDEAEAAGDAE